MPFKNPHPLYHVWQGMRQRCTNPNNRQFADYGGRGITFDPRWDCFQTFLDDMGPRPDGYTLDRIDNDKGYSPENCRWADRKTQQRNRRIAVYVTIDGTQYRAIELADIAGVKTDTILSRVERGLSYSEVISPDPLYGTDTRAAVEGRKRIARTRTHCWNGHKFEEHNTYFTKEGYKRCRTCQNIKAKRLRLAKKRGKS